MRKTMLLVLQFALTSLQDRTGQAAHGLLLGFIGRFVFFNDNGLGFPNVWNCHFWRRFRLWICSLERTHESHAINTDMPTMILSMLSSAKDVMTPSEVKSPQLWCCHVLPYPLPPHQRPGGFFFRGGGLGLLARLQMERCCEWGMVDIWGLRFTNVYQVYIGIPHSVGNFIEFITFAFVQLHFFQRHPKTTLKHQKERTWQALRVTAPSLFFCVAFQQKIHFNIQASSTKHFHVFMITFCCFCGTPPAAGARPSGPVTVTPVTPIKPNPFIDS